MQALLASVMVFEPHSVIQVEKNSFVHVCLYIFPTCNKVLPAVPQIQPLSPFYMIVIGLQQKLPGLSLENVHQPPEYIILTCEACRGSLKMQMEPI